MVLIFVVSAASLVWMQNAGEGLFFVLAILGNGCFLYTAWFVASVVTRADLGTTARSSDVLRAAASLFFLSFVGMCLLQRRVNRVYRRVCEER